MNPMLDKMLCERFPKLYADRHGSMQQTAMNCRVCHRLYKLRHP